MIDYEETREDAMLSLEQQIKQLVRDAFDKGYQCGYKDRKTESSSEIPNNCDDCIWSVCNYNKAFGGEPQTGKQASEKE